MKLTSKAVAALMLPEGKDDHIEWDDDRPGFGYRLRKSGERVARSWVVQYRHAGQTRRMTLDSILSAEQARDQAKKILAKVALDQDPATEKKRRASADKFTFAAMGEEFLMAKEGTVRPRTLTEAKRYLQGSYFKPLHTMSVDAITRRDVAARLLVIGRESGSVTAARARSALSGMYAWARGQGLAETNPVVGTNRPKTAPPRDRVLTDQELGAIWNAAGDDDFGRIVRLLIATGQRRSEVGGIAFTELDLEHGTWTIPAARTKNGRQHTLPLSGLAQGIIESVPQQIGRDHLFGARAPRGFSAWASAKDDLDARLGNQFAPFVLHDIRRSVATRMCDLGILPHVVEQVLNHRSGHRRGPAGVYNRSPYEREVKAAMAAWDRHLRALIEGRDEKQRKVIPIRGGE
jgi:integrase